MPKIKSTHKGHCQFCGRLQMLPNGNLAKHGYTINHGYFSGTCIGSENLPFEQSCSLLESIIKSAEINLSELKIFQENLRKPATKTECYYYIYHDGNWKHKGYYLWEIVQVRFVVYNEDAVEYAGIEYLYDDKWKKTSWFCKKTEEDLLKKCTEQNIVYANWHMHYLKNLENFINWQQNRMKNWSVKDLLPVETKDKDGFKLEEAPY